MNTVCRFDLPTHATPEQQRALDDFNERTNNEYNQVRDLSLIGTYARSRGWWWIADALLPKKEEA